MAIIDFFDRGWRRNRDGLAYVMGQQAWTFEEARIHSCRVAVGVRRLVQGREGTAAVLAPNSPAAWMCVLGIWRAGLAWLPLNPGYPPKVLADHLRRFDGRLVFFDSRLLNEVMELQADLSRHGGKVQFVCLDEPIASFQSVTDWRDTSYAEAEANPIVAIMPTGGTTGRPKGVVVTQRNATAFVSHVLAEFTYKADEAIVNLAAAPLTHTAGMLSIPVSARGGTVAMLERADPKAILKAIETYGVTETFLPPTVIYRLLEQGDVSQYDLASLKYLLYGAAPMSTAKLKQALAVFGPVMMEGYGQTEAFASISVLRPEEHFLNGSLAPDTRLKSCGRPSTYIDLRIVKETGETAESGETGEICVRGDVVTPGYYKDPEQTAAAIIDGWLHTGDVGHLDEAGYLHLTDRKKDMIITGGLNVYPAEVEQVLWSHPEVADCAVVGIPDDDWGERVVAVIETTDGRPVDNAELLAWCRSELGAVKTPKELFHVDSLPRSPNGKVMRREAALLFRGTLKAEDDRGDGPTERKDARTPPP